MQNPHHEIAATGYRPRHATAYTVGLARGAEEVLEAQRLRYTVFADELGAHLPMRLAGHDIDHFDAFCEHLLVRESGAHRVVGTCRLLTPEAARRIGSYCAENQFYLTRLQHLRRRMVEAGRFCVHPDFRHGAVVAKLWSGLAEFMRGRQLDTLVGCASISMVDGGHNAANLFRQLAPEQMAPVEYSVFPCHRLPIERLANGRPALIPPSIKGCLRAGAWICGEPAWNPDFNAADLPLLLPMARITPRYFRHAFAPTR